MMSVTLAEAFKSRANSIGFLRWLMAFMVIMAHAGPIAGFYGGKDLGTQISTEQSIGGVAVGGFFFFSGFLITKSRLGSASTLRFFWRRVLRIMPAFWLVLLLTAGATFAWFYLRGTLGEHLSNPEDSPLTYFWNNMWLSINQETSGGIGNGSLWTLIYEFRAYILVGLLGLFGMLVNRVFGIIVAIGIIALSCLQWLHVDLSSVFGLSDYKVLLLMAPFAVGMLFALLPEKIVIDDRVAIAAILISAAAYAFGGWLMVGQYAFCYVLMWFAIRATRLQHWERFGDFSYGIYIFSWPIMQVAVYAGLQKNWLIYHLVVLVACHVLAFLSWHLIEKPAMSLKDWTPAPVVWLLNLHLLTKVKRLFVRPSKRATGALTPAWPRRSPEAEDGAQ